MTFSGTVTKAQLLAEIRRHQELDSVVQGTYGEEKDGQWRGCTVGCTLHSLGIVTGEELQTDKHEIIEEKLGIPQVVSHLADRIFEGLGTRHKKWTEEWIDAIPENTDLSLVFPNMMIFILKDCRVHAAEDGQKAIDQCIALFERQASGDTVAEEDWQAAGDAADAAARAAAKAARTAWAAAGAAEAAAWAAKAARTAWAAAGAAEAAAWAAEAAAYERYADEFIRLLKKA